LRKRLPPTSGQPAGSQVFYHGLKLIAQSGFKSLYQFPRSIQERNPGVKITLIFNELVAYSLKHIVAVVLFDEHLVNMPQGVQNQVHALQFFLDFIQSVFPLSQ
jgi:hypothetical protein